MDSAEYARLVVANMPFAAVLQINSPNWHRNWCVRPWRGRRSAAPPVACCTGSADGVRRHGWRGLRGHEPAAGAATSTIESKTNFFRAVRDGTVTATSVPLHVGRSTIVVQTDLGDDDGGLVARVTQTQAVLAAKAR